MLLITLWRSLGIHGKVSVTSQISDGSGRLALKQVMLGEGTGVWAYFGNWGYYFVSSVAGLITLLVLKR